MSKPLSRRGPQPFSTAGYLAPAYAESLREFGEPHLLPASRGLILKRRIQGTDYKDAMGCYPLFACRDWSSLVYDLENLKDELVALAVVTDPFGDYDVDSLKRCFRDKVVPFKEHFIVDLSRPLDEFVHSHHRRNAVKALDIIDVERCEFPSLFLDDWHELYANLISRHQIKGLTAFSRQSFAEQLRVPGIVALRAIHQGKTVGMTLWYEQRDMAYYHLGAYSDEGYNLRASFALFWWAMSDFAGSGVRWLNLGAGAGASGDGTDGLTRFKKGWSNGTRTAYFCGRIFSPAKYEEILRARDIQATDYFPAYRKGEFA